MPPVPEKIATNGSVPPGAITVPAALVPPPKPYVCRRTSSPAVNVSVVSKTALEEARVPVNDSVETVSASEEGIRNKQMVAKATSRKILMARFSRVFIG